MFQLIRYNIAVRMTNRFWVIIPLILLIVSKEWTNNVRFDYLNKVDRLSNILDLAPVTMGNPFIVSWIYILGFILVIGDAFSSDLDSGILFLTMARCPSRVTWWHARLSSILLLALLFSACLFLATLVGGVLGGLPISLSDSEASCVLSTNTDLATWYLRDIQIPMWLFNLIIVIYMGLTLGVLGCLLEALAFVTRSSMVAMAVFLAWLLTCFLVAGSIVTAQRAWLVNLLDLRYFTSYGKHFGTQAAPKAGFLLILSAGYALAFAAGAQYLRQRDL